METVGTLPLTKEAYLPFGNVIEATDNAIPTPDRKIVLANQGTALRFNRLLSYQNQRGENNAPMNVCVFRAQPVTIPFQIKLLERHKHSTQVFIPMNAHKRYLVIVAKGGDQPDLSTLKCFIASNSQGISYYPGIWHHPMCSLDNVTDFACLVSEDGTSEDTHVVDLQKPILCKESSKL
eukprot:TRINITY_DN2974_c0_g1_i1.p1 TRINITY_DN2974_c0_g1~~TRINITY_DN2974_c0_g1_i1.p1  ORF type:complete len:188 (+),score=16.64 TRINITY_DN2974_c0_g1_i1:28-564(+)